MPAAHVCPTCGIDLADIAPVRERFYALLVRFCPQCHAPRPVWEGGKHPVTRGWRIARLLIRSLRALIHRAIALGLITIASVGFGSLGSDLGQVQLSPAQLLNPRPGAPGFANLSAVLYRAIDSAEWVLVTLVGLTVVALVIGILASTLWRHLTLVGAWLMLTTWIMLTASIEGLVVTLDSLSSTSARAWTADQWLNALGLPLLISALIPLGFLPGIAFNTMVRSARRKLWSRALRNARRRKRA